MQTLDWVVLALCLALAWLGTGFSATVFSWIEQQFGRLARHKWVSVLVIGVFAILGRVAILPWFPVPQPKIHDEFSYLLAADTFVHGRLANPSHSLWIFFDTFHVIQHPSYASMYPAAQGMVLAVGKLLAHPWVGVLLSMAAMCMAITWMLQGWMPAEWAFLGGILVLMRFGWFSYWMNSYWGGAVAATGAALVLGSLPRIWEYSRPRDALLFGLGAGVLAISRPVEGFLFCLPFAIALLWQIRPGGGSSCKRYWRSVLFPLSAALACFVGFIAFYNWRVTGSPIVFPHMIEQRQYIKTAIFLWQRDKPPIAYANAQFDDFYNRFLPGLYQRSWPAALGQLDWKSTAFWQFYLGPALSFPFLALPWLMKERRNRLLLAQCVLSALGLWVIVYYNPHYAAPLMVTTVVLMMEGLRLVRSWTFRGRGVGLAVTRFVVLSSLLVPMAYFVRTAAYGAHPIPDTSYRHEFIVLVILAIAYILVRAGFSISAQRFSRWRWIISFCEFALLAGILFQIAVIQRDHHPDDFPFVEDLAERFRLPVEKELASLPGEHLVLVRYSKDHNSGEEYVYNEADIDRAKTVWAREIPGMDLSPLVSYFKNRDVWVFEPDVDNQRIIPYSPQAIR